jgi:hypothetical protein
VKLGFLALGAILSIAYGSGSVPASAGALTVEGTQFVLRSDDGRVMRGEQLTGVVLALRDGGRDFAVRIAGTETIAAAGHELVLYRMITIDPATGASHPLCHADAKGRETAFPVPNGSGGFTLTCTSGAEAKCIMMGYRPWEVRADGAPMAQLHRACIHLIRADYGGDDRPATRDGTTIDIYDRYGIQSPSDISMSFEAAWGVDGAVCVARPRFAEIVSLEALAERYPRLRPTLGPDFCTDEAARADPAALLFNRSDARAPSSR